MADRCVQIDGVSGREIHLEAVDAVLQLVGDILAAVSPRRRGRQAVNSASAAARRAEPTVDRKRMCDFVMDTPAPLKRAREVHARSDQPRQYGPIACCDGGRGLRAGSLGPSSVRIRGLSRSSQSDQAAHVKSVGMPTRAAATVIRRFDPWGDFRNLPFAVKVLRTVQSPARRPMDVSGSKPASPP